MLSRVVDVQQERTKRELRLKIARLRRRIDRRVRSVGRSTRRLGSWRSYVTSYPGCALVTAFGTGLAASAGFSARRITRWLGLQMIRRATDAAGRQLRRELRQLWADSTPKNSHAETAGSRNEQA